MTENSFSASSVASDMWHYYNQRQSQQQSGVFPPTELLPYDYLKPPAPFWKVNFCQSPLPVEQPPPFPPDFLACFPPLLSRRSLVLSFCLSRGQCCILRLLQMPAWALRPSDHSSIMGMAGIAPCHRVQHWAGAQEWEAQRHGDGLRIPSQTVLSATFAWLHQGQWVSPGVTIQHRLIWEFCWQSVVNREAEKKYTPSLSELAQALWQRSQHGGGEASEVVFQTAWFIPPRELVKICHLAKEVSRWPK